MFFYTILRIAKAIKYLLNSPDLVENANIHSDNDLGFRWACEYNQQEIVNFSIFDMYIEKSIYIQWHLNNYPNEEAQKLFKLRDLNEKLNQELKINKTLKNKTKI